MTNDNAHDYVCAACGTTLDFAFVAGSNEPVPQAVKQMTLTQEGWRIIGEEWFCSNHGMRLV